MMSIFKICFQLTGYGLMCYQCAPSMPGCNEFNWRGMGYLGKSCPEEDDICVKLIERKGGECFMFIFVLLINANIL